MLHSVCRPSDLSHYPGPKARQGCKTQGSWVPKSLHGRKADQEPPLTTVERARSKLLVRQALTLWGTVISAASIPFTRTGNKDSVLLVIQNRGTSLRSPAFNGYQTALKLQVPTVIAFLSTTPHPGSGEGDRKPQTAAKQCGS